MSIVLFNYGNKDVFSIGPLMIHEWVILALFTIYTLLYFNYLKITWVDKLFLLFLLFIIIIPVISNMFNIIDGEGNIIGFILPIKIWLVYRIIYSALIRYNTDSKIQEIFVYVLNIIIVFSIISALIGIIRVLQIPFISDSINLLWPIKRYGIDPIEWGRLVSTVSGTNGSGIYFVACMFISIYLYNNNKNIIYIITTIIFFMSIILTGSFSAIGTLLILIPILIYKLKKNLISYKKIFSMISLVLLLSYAVTSLENLHIFTKNVIEARVERQLQKSRSPYPFIPSTLYTRASRWSTQLSILKEKPLFGYGSAIPEEQILRHVSTAQPHNYYVYILMNAGIVGFAVYVLFLFLIIKKISNNKKFKNEKILIGMIFSAMIISQIALLTFQYGGYSELIGILLAFIYRFK